MTHDETLAAVLAQLAEVRTALAEQREINAEQREAISALREEMRQREPSPEAAAWLAHPEAVGAHDSAQAAQSAQPEQAGARRKGTSRRGLLRTAAAGAAAAAVATVAAGNVEQAHAATGGNLILGQTNDANAATTLQPTSGSTPATLLTVDNRLSGSNGTAVYAVTSNGAAAVQAMDTGAGFGLHASSQASIAIFASSGTGIDLLAGGSGRIVQSLQLQVGAPTSGDHSMGESIRDANGDLWLCTAGGWPGTWMKVAHLAPGATRGGAITYLDNPIRVFDSRTGYTDALFHPSRPCTSTSATTVQISGDYYNSVAVPTSAAGAIGNVTVVNPAGGGYIALVPSGVGFTGTANIAYGLSQTFSNFFNVGLSSGGALDIIIGGASTDVIIDLFAVVA